MIKLNIGNFNPDPVWHRYISFAKSGIRLVAAAALGCNEFVWAGGLFFLAEVLGIVEELV